MYRLCRLSYQCVRGGIEAPTSVSLIMARRHLCGIRTLRRATTRGKFSCSFYTTIGGPRLCVVRISGLTTYWRIYPLVLKEKTRLLKDETASYRDETELASLFYPRKSGFCVWRLSASENSAGSCVTVRLTLREV